MELKKKITTFLLYSSIIITIWLWMLSIFTTANASQSLNQYCNYIDNQYNLNNTCQQEILYHILDKHNYTKKDIALNTKIFLIKTKGKEVVIDKKKYIRCKYKFNVYFKAKTIGIYRYYVLVDKNTNKASFVSKHKKSDEKEKIQFLIKKLDL